MNILCTICARGNSKGVTNKALRVINKTPLIGITIKQALKSKVFREIVISTDSKKIQKIGKEYGAKSWFLRPRSLSNDFVSKISAIRHTLIESEKHFKVSFDVCVDLDITSPLRSIKDIKESVKLFQKNKFSNLFSVCEAKKNPYFNMIELKNNKVHLIKKTKNTNITSKVSSNTWSSFTRRQSSPKVFDMNASIYIWSRSLILNSDNLFHKNTGIYIMPQSRSVDIDTLHDLNVVKKLIGNGK